MTAAITVEGLGKRYKIARVNSRGGYRTLRETLSEGVVSLVGRLRGRAGAPALADFWALRDVGFEVQAGKVVGIVGRNGAGKSTLLKILSRITKPTTGHVKIRGRVGSLLEVGTGFHPELTGRENTFLNGSILGMSRREIARRFDEIVAFAEIEEFLDTPVKRYSSGMYVRLAFAVAAHLEPEILLVDEVLAVGDFRFQKKCLAKMREVGRSGRTVLFVSHNMAALEALCDHCILIDQGAVKAQGETRSILAEYSGVGEDQASGSRDLTDHVGRTNGSLPLMARVTLSDGAHRPVARVRMGSSLSFHVDFDLKGTPVEPVLGVVIKTDLGMPLFGASNVLIPGCAFGQAEGSGTISCHLKQLPLMPGTYLVDLYFSSWALANLHRNLDSIHDAIAFEVVRDDVFGSGKLAPQAAGPIFWPATFGLQLTANPR